MFSWRALCARDVSHLLNLFFFLSASSFIPHTSHTCAGHKHEILVSILEWNTLNGFNFLFSESRSTNASKWVYASAVCIHEFDYVYEFMTAVPFLLYNAAHTEATFSNVSRFLLLLCRFRTFTDSMIKLKRFIDVCVCMWTFSFSFNLQRMGKFSQRRSNRRVYVWVCGTLIAGVDTSLDDFWCQFALDAIFPKLWDKASSRSNEWMFRPPTQRSAEHSYHWKPIRNSILKTNFNEKRKGYDSSATQH